MFVAGDLFMCSCCHCLFATEADAARHVNAMRVFPEPINPTEALLAKDHLNKLSWRHKQLDKDWRHL